MGNTIFIIIAAALFICAALELIFDLKFIKRILLSIISAFIISYLISPVIPYGTDADKILSFNFSNTVGNSVLEFLMIFFGLTALFMIFSIFFDKITEVILNLFMAIYFGLSAFICLISNDILSKLTDEIPSLIQTQDLDKISDLISSFSISKIAVIAAVLLTLAIIAIQLTAFFKFNKYYNYVNISLFCGLILTFSCILIIFCVYTNEVYDFITVLNNSESSNIEELILNANDILKSIKNAVLIPIVSEICISAALLTAIMLIKSKKKNTAASKL